jgi:hypothetical protein
VTKEGCAATAPDVLGSFRCVLHLTIAHHTEVPWTMLQACSPDGAKRNPGLSTQGKIPHSATRHAGYTGYALINFLA